MKKLVIVSSSRRVEDAVKAVGVDEESLAILLTHGNRDYAITTNINTLFLETSDVVRAVSVVVSYAQGFERVRVVVSDPLDPYTATSALLSFIALATLEPFNSFYLEPLALYSGGRLREFSGKPRLCIRSSKDLRILSALSFGCMTCKDIALRVSTPVETVRRRVVELSKAGLVDVTRKGKSLLYCINDAGRMLIT
jgi:hypothetical protein